LIPGLENVQSWWIDPEELTYAEYPEGVGMKWNPR